MYLAKQVLVPDLECELMYVTKYEYGDLSVLGFELLEGCKNKDSGLAVTRIRELDSMGGS
jgi:hypothetical protein